MRPDLRKAALHLGHFDEATSDRVVDPAELWFISPPRGEAIHPSAFARFVTYDRVDSNELAAQIDSILNRADEVIE